MQVCHKRCVFIFFYYHTRETNEIKSRVFGFIITPVDDLKRLISRGWYLAFFFYFRELQHCTLFGFPGKWTGKKSAENQNYFGPLNKDYTKSNTQPTDQRHHHHPPPTSPPSLLLQRRHRRRRTHCSLSLSNSTIKTIITPKCPWLFGGQDKNNDKQFVQNGLNKTNRI